jgi:hypothetical protein
MSEFSFNDLDGTGRLSNDALSNLQCNIVRSTGRAACDHVFHRFSTKQAFADWLAVTPPPSPANAAEPNLVNILFTCEGLKRLGVSDDVLQEMDPAFRRGTRNSRSYRKLGDPMASNWDQEHRAAWHAIELRWHHPDPAANAPPVTAGEHTCFTESGHAIGRDGKPIARNDLPRYNHFGILDGTAKPVYTEQDYEAELATRAPTMDNWKWDPRQKLSTLLVHDPLANQADAYGSYFVFRKFKQDVGRFREKLAETAGQIAQLLKSSQGKQAWQWKQYPAFETAGDERFQELSEALKGAKQSLHDALSENPAGVALAQAIFGVGPDGQRPTGTTDNDFNYADDPEGKKCPFSAHARAANARGSRGVPQFERKTLIARRGISHKNGTLFWCAQASIGDQFEYIQEKWANLSNVNPDHNPSPGVDYVIGRPSAAQATSAVVEAQGFSLSIEDTIQLRASEYLFAPSLLGFRRLQALGGVR